MWKYELAIFGPTLILCILLLSFNYVSPQEPIEPNKLYINTVKSEIVERRIEDGSLYFTVKTPGYPKLTDFRIDEDKAGDLKTKDTVKVQTYTWKNDSNETIRKEVVKIIQ